MSELSPGLTLAWRLAATEAGAAGYAKIECAHLMMGLLSLDKASPRVLKELGLDPDQMDQVGGEQTAISELFGSASVSPPVLRRDLRARVKKRPPRAKGLMSRSAASRAAFTRAEILASGRPVNGLHLLSVLLRDPDPAIASLMTARRLDPDLATRAEIAAAHPFDAVLIPRGPAPSAAPSRDDAPPARLGAPVQSPANVPKGGSKGSVATTVDARLLKLEAHLKSKIIGQDDAVAKVAARIRLAHSGLSERRGPFAVFLLLGPRGAGKTEMARALAKFLFGGPDNLTRFDMSEYMEEHSVSRLIGAPPGHVGKDESGQLTEAIRRKPRSLILFDAVEKAHPKVLDVFLQLFSAGRLSDTQGLVADGRDLIVVMTSHLGGGPVPGSPGFVALSDTVPFAKAGKAKAELRRFFRPELLNRIDDTITFRQLDEADVRRIVRPLLAALATKVRKTHGVFVRFEAEAEAFVIRSGFDAEKGVRELKAVIERLVEVPLSGLALSGKLAQHPAWKAVYDEGGLYFLPE